MQTILTMETRLLHALGRGQTARNKRPRLGLAAVCALMSMLLLAGLGAVFLVNLVGSGWLTANLTSKRDPPHCLAQYDLCSILFAWSFMGVFNSLLFWQGLGFLQDHAGGFEQRSSAGALTAVESFASEFAAVALQDQSLLAGASRAGIALHFPTLAENHSASLETSSPFSSCVGRRDMLPFHPLHQQGRRLQPGSLQLTAGTETLRREDIAVAIITDAGHQDYAKFSRAWRQVCIGHE